MIPRHDVPGPPAPATRARTLLAGARCGVLTLNGWGARGHVGVVDEDGEPFLLVAPGAAVLTAAERGQPACLEIPAPGRFPREWLRLAGRLRPVPPAGQETAARLLWRRFGVVSDEPYHTVGLTVTEALLYAGRSPVPIALPDYALADPDLVAAAAPGLLAHLNDGHGAELMTLAVTTGIPPGAGELAGVRADALDRHGLTLWCAGSEGAVRVDVRFRGPVATAADIGRELRGLLPAGWGQDG